MVRELDAGPILYRVATPLPDMFNTRLSSKDDEPNRKRNYDDAFGDPAPKSGGGFFGGLFGGLALFFAALIDLALRFAQKPEVVLGVLLEVLGRDPVVTEAGIAGKLGVLVDDLLRGSPHLAFGAGTVEHPIDDIPGRTAVALVPGA